MNLVGKCLIARPHIADSLFKRSVVFIYEQNMQGVAGLIVNKRKSGISANDIILNRGFAPGGPDELVYAGGPVNENSVILLHTSEWSSSNTLNVTKELSVSSDDLMFFKLTNDNKPNGYKFCCGVAVWHPQQIVAEIRANQWLISRLSTHQILDVDSRQLWDEAVETNAKQTIDKFL